MARFSVALLLLLLCLASLFCFSLARRRRSDSLTKQQLLQDKIKKIDISPEALQSFFSQNTLESGFVPSAQGKKFIKNFAEQGLLPTTCEDAHSDGFTCIDSSPAGTIKWEIFMPLLKATENSFCCHEKICKLKERYCLTEHDLVSKSGEKISFMKPAMERIAAIVSWQLAAVKVAEKPVDLNNAQVQLLTKFVELQTVTLELPTPKIEESVVVIKKDDEPVVEEEQVVVEDEEPAVDDALKKKQAEESVLLRQVDQAIEKTIKKTVLPSILSFMDDSSQTELLLNPDELLDDEDSPNIGGVLVLAKRTGNGLAVIGDTAGFGFREYTSNFHNLVQPRFLLAVIAHLLELPLFKEKDVKLQVLGFTSIESKERLQELVEGNEKDMLDERLKDKFAEKAKEVGYIHDQYKNLPFNRALRVQQYVVEDFKHLKEITPEGHYRGEYPDVEMSDKGFLAVGFILYTGDEAPKWVFPEKYIEKFPVSKADKDARKKEAAQKQEIQVLEPIQAFFEGFINIFRLGK